MNLKDFKTKILKDKNKRAAYERYDLAHEVGQMLIEARTIRGITQSDLAKKMGTQQSNVARAESGRWYPGLKFLERMAKAYKSNLIPPRFAFMSDFSWSERIEKLKLDAPQAYTDGASQSAESNIPLIFTSLAPAFTMQDRETANLSRG